ncbi:MAG TPA: hypothetical protein PK155_07145 [Bacteroidales bacterium]|nr:hypothetical protein [Bacteroidales bacterium]
MTTGDIAEIFGIKSYTNKVLRDDKEILSAIKAFKSLSEKFNEIYENAEDEDDGI